MVQAVFSAHGALSSTQDDALQGLNDLLIVQNGTEVRLFSVTYGDGWLTSFDIGDGPGQSREDGNWQIDKDFRQLETTDLVLFEAGGLTSLYMAGLKSDHLNGVQIDITSNTAPFQAAQTVSASGSDLSTFAEMALFDGTSLGLAALRTGGLVNVSFEPGGNLSVTPLNQGDAMEDMRGSDIITATHNGQNFAFVSYEDSNRVGMFRQDNGTLSHVADASIETGLWVDRPNALAVTEAADGQLYVVAAASGSGSLSVLEINPDGTSLRPVDHLIDNTDTRFANASHVTSVTIQDRNFILAAGNEQGISLLTVLPGGRLQHIDVMPGNADTPLRGINTLEAMATPDGIRIWAGTDTAPYLAEFSVALPNLGETRIASAQGGQLAGTSGDDILMGGDTADTLLGGGGDDILSDGSGADRLSGGIGADTFIFLKDTARDVITDFDLARDTIDVSDYGQLGAIGTLSIQSQSWGAVITIGDDALEVRSADDSRLRASDFTTTNLVRNHRSETDPALYPSSGSDPDPGPDPIPDPDTPPNPQPEPGTPTPAAPTLPPPTAPPFYAPPDVSLTWQSGDRRGDATPELFTGFGQDDRFFGEAGNDTLNAGAGSDAISGGAGDDEINGADGGDLGLGGTGHDMLNGGNGGDTLLGGSGRDTLFGGNGNDTLLGDAGNDHLEGQNNSDHIWGGAGADRIYGGAGDDWLSAGSNAGFSIDGVWGQAGDDTIFGNEDADLLNGGTGDDILVGGSGQDRLFGKDGADILLGGDDFDRLFGGAGDDQLDGGAGADGLFGQEGNDTLWGSAGADRFFGGTGDDLLDGGSGDDTLSGDAGRDTLYGSTGDDTLEGGEDGDAFVFTEDHGNDVIVDFDLIEAYELLNLEQITRLNNLNDVLAVSDQIDADLRITTSPNSSILIKNIELSELSEDDFAF